MNNYIKLNNNDNHLSLGNLFRIIKEISINKTSAIQSEIFCILFNQESVNDTTIGNYCTGYRSINNKYKQIYITYQKKYQKDNTYLLETINNLLTIIDGKINNYNSIEDINKSQSLKNLIIKLNILLSNDIYIPLSTKKEINILLNNNDYYNTLCNILFYIILEKKQPIYIKDELLTTIEELLEKTNMSINDLNKYLNITLEEGINHIPSLKKLSKSNNPYALNELGNLEYTGFITGTPRYDIAYSYYKQASSYNHPSSLWMISHMIINKKIGSLSEDDIKISWEYLNKAKNLNSIAAINTMGICYLHGYNPDKEINIQKAISYFKEASSLGYIYSYNNLGKIYEEKKDTKKAFEYYIISANLEESWACNKVGEYYRQGLGVKKDLEQAFKYYTLGLNSDILNQNPWNNYNLVKYFYYPGNTTLGIKKDLTKSLELLNNSPLPESQELLLYIYYEKYLQTQKKEYLDKTNYYLSILNNNPKLNTKYKIEIENNLNNLKKQISIYN